MIGEKALTLLWLRGVGLKISTNSVVLGMQPHYVVREV